MRFVSGFVIVTLNCFSIIKTFLINIKRSIHNTINYYCVGIVYYETNEYLHKYQQQYFYDNDDVEWNETGFEKENKKRKGYLKHSTFNDDYIDTINITTEDEDKEDYGLYIYMEDDKNILSNEFLFSSYDDCKNKSLKLTNELSCNDNDEYNEDVMFVYSYHRNSKQKQKQKQKQPKQKEANLLHTKKSHRVMRRNTL